MKFVLRLFSLLTVAAASFIFFTSPAHAATLNVVAGTDGIEENSQCQLSEAIQNINDQSQTNLDCPAGDGSDDTINLPAGTITLSGDLPGITRSMAIRGQGSNQTNLSGNLGDYRMFQINITSPGGVFSLQGVKAQGWRHYVAVSGNGSINLSDIEADGESAEVGDEGAFNFGSYGSSSMVAVDNVHIHNITADDDYIHILNIWNQTGSMEIDVRDVTINDIVNLGGGINTMALGIGVMTGAAEGTFTGNLKNITVKDIDALGGAVAIGLFTNGGLGDANATLNVDNSTISHMRSNPSFFGSINALMAVATEGDGQETTSNLVARNVIVSDALEGGLSSNCGVLDASSLFGLGGVGSPSITSLGGNISDDASCNSAFTHPTDQTEVSNLASTLGPLSDNGGSVPTIPLLPGSPAIDAGVTVPGLTTDARGISRPQCAAFDSGAYEYNGTCPETSGGSDPDPIPDVVEDAAPNNGDGNGDGTPDSEQANVTSLPIPSGTNQNTYVTLVTPDGTTLTTTAIQQATDLAASDSVYDYPLGLVSFTVDGVTPGTTIPVTLYFHTTQSPDSFTPRKYLPSTQTFFDIPGATLTTEQIGSNPTLKLTYNLTDGGDLDDDQAANGTIVDPVGLGAKATLASTGESQLAWLLLAWGSVLTGLITLAKPQSLRIRKA